MKQPPITESAGQTDTSIHVPPGLRKPILGRGRKGGGHSKRDLRERGEKVSGHALVIKIA